MGVALGGWIDGGKNGEIPDGFNKFTLVCRCVDSYLPRFTSSHGQNVEDSRGAAE